MKDRDITVIILTFAFAVALLIFAFTPHARLQSRSEGIPATVQGWQYGEPPERESIIALYETEPGFYEAFSVIRIGSDYIADRDGPSVVLKRSLPTWWARLP